MLLKRPDDKSKRVVLLESLQNAPAIDARQRKWAREELVRLRRGIQGESEAAYFLEQYFKDGENHVLLNDLRFIVEGDVVQIDHLIINRGIGMYLVETKNYGGNVSINERGEFTMAYDNERFGVASPLEQSQRHARILQRLLKRLGIVGRTGAPLDCYHVVMFHPRAIITRPKAKEFDTSNVIKADQFPSWHGQFVEKEFGVSKLLRATVNLRSLATIKEWGEMLMRQHRPVDLLALPEFMDPKAEPHVLARTAAPETLAEPVHSAAEPPMPIGASAPAAQTSARKLICLHCHAKISFAEGKFCWNNATRFQGGQYCRQHQGLF